MSTQPTPSPWGPASQSDTSDPYQKPSRGDTDYVEQLRHDDRHGHNRAPSLKSSMTLAADDHNDKDSDSDGPDAPSYLEAGSLNRYKQSWSFAAEKARAEGDANNTSTTQAPLLQNQEQNWHDRYSLPSALQQDIYVAGKTKRNATTPVRLTPFSGYSSWFRSLLVTQFGIKMTPKQFAHQILLLTLGGLITWIPGIVALVFYKTSKASSYDKPDVLNVGLFWWSAWLSTMWVGIWVCWLLAVVAPIVLRFLLPPSNDFGERMHQQLLFVAVTRRYLAAWLWSFLLWMSYLGLIWLNFPGRAGIDPSIVLPLESGNSTSSNNSSSSNSSSSANLTSTLWPGQNEGESSSSGSSNTGSPFATLGSAQSWHVGLSRFFFALFICSTLLLAEKLVIQNIAHSFHSVTYSDRIEKVKYQTTILVTLYKHTRQAVSQQTRMLRAERVTPSGISVVAAGEKPIPLAKAATLPPSRPAEARPQRSDWTTLRDRLALDVSLGKGFAGAIGKMSTSKPIFSAPFSPERIIEATLDSDKETQKLAHRLFEAFAVPCTTRRSDEEGVRFSTVTLASIAPLFKSTRAAKKAFAELDRDENGGCTLEELTTSCMEIHDERVHLLTSMHDVDSAVAKLDHILKTLVIAASAVVIAALLSIRFSTLIASLGTIMLGLSWLVSSTAQEALLSTVWVFCKHPLDVGDCVVVPGLLSASSASTTDDELSALQGCNDGDTFVVEEMMLLSTRMLATTTGKSLVVSNAVLAKKPIINLRRSGPIAEPMQVAVAYDTPFDNLERLRKAMAAWINTQRCDYRPGIDIAICGLRSQDKLLLTLEIRYKSNWQNGALRLRRRNRWLSALRYLMSKHGIKGPSSNAQGKTKPSAGDSDTGGHVPKDGADMGTNSGAIGAPPISTSAVLDRVPVYELMEHRPQSPTWQDMDGETDESDDDASEDTEDGSNSDDAMERGEGGKEGPGSNQHHGATVRPRLNEALLPVRRCRQDKTSMPSDRPSNLHTFFRQHGSSTQQVDDGRAMGQGYPAVDPRSGRANRHAHF